ncbi:MAG: NAD-glutamate dehydrogenase [Gammaproteobacteria bacterium]|jgi:glutamate dehydrogenase|nr:NAD-glutamate dehydrogenase [Gammaproteobacteria bacterium]
MTTSITASRQEMINDIKAACGEPFKCAKGAEHFAEQFLRRTSSRDLARFSTEQMAGIIRNMAAFTAQYRSTKHALRVYNPDPDQHGFECSATVVEMVAVDSPFLVDTLSMRLSELGQFIKLIIHPVMWFELDEQQRPQRLMQHNAGKGQPYSLIHVQIEKQVNSRLLNKIKRNIQMALTQVKMAVDDWQPMQERVSDIIAHIDENLPDGNDDRAEPLAFMQWLLDENFIFLGFREYVMVKADQERELHMKPGSGLGIMSHHQGGQAHRKLLSLSEGAQSAEQAHDLIIITKTNARSPVHRSGYMDYIGVLRYNRKGKVVGEHRILGMFTSLAYNQPTTSIPILRRKIVSVVSKSKLRKGSHECKALLHILETLPRDELLQASADELFQLAIGVLDLQERPQTQLFIRRERYGRFYSCLVYIPRDRFNTENRVKIQNILKRGLGGEHVDFSVQVSESNLALLHVIIRPRDNSGQVAAAHVLQDRIWAALTLWRDELKSTLINRFGDARGLALTQVYENAFPAAYREDISAWVASFDIENLDQLSDDKCLRTSLYAPHQVRIKHLLRFKLFRLHEALPLSSVLPTLENLGVRVISERPYKIELHDNQQAWIQDFDIVPDTRMSFDLTVVKDSFCHVFREIQFGRAEDDGFNRLVVAANLSSRQIAMLRAYCRYLLQTGMPFSQSYMEDILAAHPILTLLLVGLFEARFALDAVLLLRFRLLAKVFIRLRKRRDDDPIESALDAALSAIIDNGHAGRVVQINLLETAILADLETVASLDEDRVMRDLFEVISATLRSNFYQLDEHGATPPYISFKLDSSKVPELPKPRPFREIWVHSPRMEGIHLRGGMVARGGLRWSDRREDFRTEVLGLLKAQSVKNTMIVPVGAKGGFVVKQPPQGSREELMQEVVACYRTLINGMLDITDNLIEGEVVQPRRVIRHDGDDNYLVVAADKGTATFSDTANAIAQARGFWLDDAFASGGSNGYDHKGMGITAKGAWESVKRHFSELGVDTQTQPFTVVGIGDMGGDVFGNGMLLSPYLCLQAAFNHLHIFIDPDPDPKTSYAERKRLFDAKASGWDQYDQNLISTGGGVYLRSAKSILLSQQVQDWLGLEVAELAPQALIQELLKAPVDLLWNGGIGTYVKASQESDEDVGDRVNNALRVNAKQLRCRVIGEGGNLGMTQLARIEYSLHGGRINTDFIDNSAGVDCSDHEVNIKILLALAVAQGKLDQPSRNQLLKDMTNDVERLVLRSNYLQSQAISTMASYTITRLGAIMHAMAVLESSGLLDRELEFLPDNEALYERVSDGYGLTRPELAVLLSYSKISLYQQLLVSDVPEDAYLAAELTTYFPSALQQSPYVELMQSHPLKREIIATQVTNSIINRMGVAFIARMSEDTGADVSSIAKAYAIVREVFDAQQFWDEVEALDRKINGDQQVRAFMQMWNVLRQATRWLLHEPDSHALDICDKVVYFHAGVKIVDQHLLKALPEDGQADFRQLRDQLLEGGFSAAFAERIAKLQFMNQALDIVDEATRQDIPVEHVLGVHFGISRVLHINWLRRQIETLSTSGNWEAHARGHLRNDLITQHRYITRKFLSWQQHKPDLNIESWQQHHRDRIQRIQSIFNDMRKQASMDIASMTVAVRSLEQLVHST